MNEQKRSAEVVIVCGIDEKYAIALSVLLHTALKSLATDSSLRCYIIDGGVSETSKEKVQRIASKFNKPVKITWLRGDLERYNNLSTRGWISRAAYLRLMIPELIPEDCSRVVYLDSDTLVKQDLTQLWLQELEGNVVLAVQDYGAPYVSDRWGIAKYEELGLSSSAPYFNSGVILIDLER